MQGSGDKDLSTRWDEYNLYNLSDKYCANIYESYKYTNLLTWGYHFQDIVLQICSQMYSMPFV